ncbi:MAG: MBL fold metallo-hydrolase [Sulfolobales archaeon]
MSEEAYEKISDNFYIIHTGIPPCEKYISSYLIITAARRAILIDPGPMNSGEKIVKVLDKLGVLRTLEMIIPTHVHLDHAGAAVYIAQRSGAAIMVHPRGIPHIRDPSRLWEESRKVQGSEITERYGRPLNGDNVEIIEARDETDLILDDVSLKILHTPGHASHHISLFWHDRSLLFTGDSAGIYIPEIDSIIPTTPPPFRYDLYIESLRNMISLKPSDIAFAHRGIRKDGDLLLKHLNQMRIWLETFLITKSEDDILKILGEKDEFTNRYLRFEDKDCMIATFNIELSIRGFLEEIKRLKSF